MSKLFWFVQGLEEASPVHFQTRISSGLKLTLSELCSVLVAGPQLEWRWRTRLFLLVFSSSCTYGWRGLICQERWRGKHVASERVIKDGVLLCWLLLLVSAQSEHSCLQGAKEQTLMGPEESSPVSAMTQLQSHLWPHPLASYFSSDVFHTDSPMDPFVPSGMC